MLRRAISAVAATAVALLTLIVASGLSWAETAPPYPAPPVTGSVASSVVATTSQSIVDSTSQSVVVQPTPAPVQPATDLASTGAGLNVGLTVGIGVAIILLGIVLVVFGARRSGRKHA